MVADALKVVGNLQIGTDEGRILRILLIGNHLGDILGNLLVQVIDILLGLLHGRQPGRAALQHRLETGVHILPHHPGHTVQLLLNAVDGNGGIAHLGMGEYIYRLVDQMGGVKGKIRKRVWMDSQTEEEILRGIREAKDLSAYDNLGNAAYLRAKEDYLMGINFSRALTLKYGNTVKGYLKRDRAVISVGRVMTCVLGMVVRREREIREFVKTPFYRVIESVNVDGHTFTGEWRAVKGSAYFESPKL